MDPCSLWIALYNPGKTQSAFKYFPVWLGVLLFYCRCLFWELLHRPIRPACPSPTSVKVETRCWMMYECPNYSCHQYFLKVESLLTASTVRALMQKQTKKPTKIQKETNKNPKQTKQTKPKPTNQTNRQRKSHQNSNNKKLSNIRVKISSFMIMKITNSICNWAYGLTPCLNWLKDVPFILSCPIKAVAFTEIHWQADSK